MAINQHASNLIDITVKAFNGDVTSVSPTDGLSLIDSWLTFLQSEGQENNPITNRLNELKKELNRGNLDGARIQDIVSDLAGQTKQLTDSADSDSKPRLTTLSEALQSFNEQLASPSPMTNPDSQAPMTSTVGGESTTSGAGVSALGASDDGLANRNGGTVSSGPTVDMDDTTGSDGISATDGSSEEINNTGDSQEANGDTYSSVSRSSRSDTSRVEGIGVSGGTGDTENSQSGGRSQY
jgi:hypothetical protein